MRKWFLISILLVGFLACDDIVEVTDISKETVTVLAPTNGSIVDTTAVIFTWSIVEEAETYQIQVAIPSFAEASQIVLDTIVSKTEVSKTLSNNNFEWRIKAKNSDYETAFVTQNFSVVTKN